MANINRWRGQIGLAPTTVEEITAVSHTHSTRGGVTFLHITLINEGDSSKAIQAAIFEQEDYVLFVKLNASSAGIQEAARQFDAFCSSITFNGGEE